MGVDTKIKVLMADGDLQNTLTRIEGILKARLPIIGDIIRNVSTSKEPFPSNGTPEQKWEAQFKQVDSGGINFTLDYPDDNSDDRKEHRSIYYHYDNFNAGGMLYLSLSCYGHSREIAIYLVSGLGGYADFNDCDDIYIDYAMPQPQ